MQKIYLVVVLCFAENNKTDIRYPARRETKNETTTPRNVAYMTNNVTSVGNFHFEKTTRFWVNKHKFALSTQFPSMFWHSSQSQTKCFLCIFGSRHIFLVHIHCLGENNSFENRLFFTRFCIYAEQCGQKPNINAIWVSSHGCLCLCLN